MLGLPPVCPFGPCARAPEAIPLALDKALGTAWDAELEPYRYAGDGAPVTLLTQVRAGRHACTRSRSRPVAGGAVEDARGGHDLSGRPPG